MTILQKKMEVARNMLEKDYAENPDDYILKNYYDYNDSVDLNLFEHSRDYVEDKIYECVEMSYFDGQDVQLIKEKLLELGVEIEDEDFISELCDDFVVRDLNFEGLLEQTDLRINMIPCQEENLDHEGSLLTISLQALVKKYLNPDYLPSYYFQDDLASEIAKSEILKVLFDSQGYDFSDLSDEEKVKESPFLSSFIEELENLYMDGSSFFVVLARVDGNEFISNFLTYERSDGKVEENKKKIVVKAANGFTMGLFDPISGSGSILDIELEKDLKLPIEEMEVQIEGRKSNYGYTVDSIYGLIPSAWRTGLIYEKE